MNGNVLISGAGVTGLALAYWLDRAGFAATLIEQAPAFRRGGQAVDIRGVALDVVEEMGLLEDARALRTRLKGMSMLDADGSETQRTEERTFSAGRLDSDDIEIFRDDLCELLMGAMSERVEFVYGDSIRAIDDQGDSVVATFASGVNRKFDLLIGADGIYSNVRKQCFDDESTCVHPLGVVLALFSTPNLINLIDWQLGLPGGGRRLRDLSQPRQERTPDWRWLRGSGICDVPQRYGSAKAACGRAVRSSEGRISPLHQRNEDDRSVLLQRARADPHAVMV